MPTWKLNIFVRVVKARMGSEGKTADEILTSYPALSNSEKQEIKDNV